MRRESPLPDPVGLITPEVEEVLTRYASAVELPEVIVEIGSYKGKSTIALARGATNSHVYAVDPWDLPGNIDGRFHFAALDTRLKFNSQVKESGFGDRITPVKGFSTEVADAWPPLRKVGLLFVDGNHSRSSVAGDYMSWWKHLSSDSTVIFDDLDTEKNPGVRQALEDLGLDFSVEAGRLAVVRHG